MTGRKLLFLLYLMLLSRAGSAQLAGTYTINPAGLPAPPNFTSFTAAVAALTAQGVGGNVEFVVSDGTYEEVIVIDDQIAATAGNPYNVVFRSAGGNPQACILRKPASGTPPANIGVGIGVLNIRGAGWDGKLKFFFNNLGIQNFEASNQRAALHVYAADGGTTFERAARNLSFTNCRFQVDTTLTTETSNQMPVMILNANSHGGTPQGGVKYPGEDISFLRCLLQGGTYGLIAKHGDGSNQASGLSVDSCEVKHQRVGNMEIDGYKDIAITHNTIKEWKGTYTSNLGVRLWRSSAFTVSGNYIDARRIALWIQNAPAYPATPVWSQVENNYMLTSLDMVVYAQSQQYIAYYHNTFKTYTNPSGDQGVFDVWNSTNIKALNNIMESPEKPGNRWIVSCVAGTFIACDYNVYYGGGATGRFFNGTGRADLAAWQANAPSLNQHSVFAPSALALNSPVITNADSARTAPPVGVTVDIYGRPRGSSPTIGAYQYATSGVPQPGPFIVKTDTVCNPPVSNVRYTIHAVPGATGYEWRYAGSAAVNINGAGPGNTFSGGAGDTTVLAAFNAGAVTGTLIVSAKNAGGSGPDRSTPVTVQATPAMPGNFTAASDTVCQGQTGVIYTVPNVPGVSYIWSYTGSGATISGAGNSVTADYGSPAAGGTLEVRAGNGCGTSAARSIAVTVNALPAQPGNFTASSAGVCAGQNGVIYTVPNVAGTTYSWAYSGAGVTINGSGSSVTADFSSAATGGTLSVTAANSCGTAARSREITVTVNPQPVVTVAPATAVAACTGDTIVLTAGAGSGYSYQWKDASGTVVGSGAVYHAYATGSYRVVVTTAAGCRDSAAAVPVTIYPLPQVQLTPGDTAFCAGGVAVLQVTTPDTGLTYRWKDGSATIPLATAGFLEITASGVYTVVAGRPGIPGCADSTPPVMVTVHPLPVAVIGWDGALLHTGAGYTAYQWYTGGQPVAGATDSVYRPGANGLYTVTVTDTNGCSNTSAAAVIDNVSVHPAAASGRTIRIYPNPAGAQVYIDAPAAVRITLHGMDGKLWYRREHAGLLDISALPAGSYLLQVRTPGGQLLKNERLVKIRRY